MAAWSSSAGYAGAPRSGIEAYGQKVRIASHAAASAGSPHSPSSSQVSGSVVSSIVPHTSRKGARSTCRSYARRRQPRQWRAAARSRGVYGVRRARRVRRVRHAAGAAGAALWRGAHHCAKARGVGIQRARQRERARGVRLRRGARRVTVAPRLQPAHHRQQVGCRAALVRGATGVVPRVPQLAAAAHVRERKHPAACRQHGALCPPLGVQRHTVWQSRRRTRGEPKELQVGGSRLRAALTHRPRIR